MALGTKLPRRSVQVPCPAPYSSRRRMQSSCRPTKLSLPLLTLAPLRQLSPPSLPAGSGSLLQPHGAPSLNRALTARPEHWLPRRSSHNSMCVICVIIIGCDIFFCLPLCVENHACNYMRYNSADLCCCFHVVFQWHVKRSIQLPGFRNLNTEIPLW